MGGEPANAGKRSPVHSILIVNNTLNSADNTRWTEGKVRHPTTLSYNPIIALFALCKNRLHSIEANLTFE